MSSTPATFKLTLRNKLLLFSTLIAVLPLLIAGQTLIRIASDELKSSANDELVTITRQVTREIDAVYKDAWLAPLSVIANAIDDENLDVEAKISLLKYGISNISDVVALQITVEGQNNPLLVSRERFSERLANLGLDAVDVIKTPTEQITRFLAGERSIERNVQYIHEANTWIATLILPLRNFLAGSRATLSARIDLSRIDTLLTGQSYSKNGFITIVDKNGQQLFIENPEQLSNFPIVGEAISLLSDNSQVISVKPYTRPDGQVMLGSFSFPRPFDWVVIAEKSEDAAYYTINSMTRNLLIWLGGGLAVAGVGAVMLSLGISRPILKIRQVVSQVGKGNFDIQVEGANSRDEIGELASGINEMIARIQERFQLSKFVSHGTMNAIQDATHGGVRLGGSRKRVAILFADIRGYTAFSENREPEIVVEVLNHYFANHSAAVDRHNGDIDKFVGDELMAVFKGPSMSEDAIRCALELQTIMEISASKHPDWKLHIGVGIDVGEVIVGAMGSPDRMDYTVLGDHVNLAARLCSAAEPRQTIISKSVYNDAAKMAGASFRSLDSIVVKGKSNAIRVFEVVKPDKKKKPESPEARTSPVAQ